MLFNSLEFILFFIVVTVLHFTTPQRWRWVFLLAASYFFYMCWKAEYALLIMASTLVTYILTIVIERSTTQKKKKLGLWGILLFNLGILFTFKYFNFFSTAINDITQLFGAENLQASSLRLLLPVGISFYTFQIIGYSLDVYWGKVKAERHLGIFALYVVFFPQLVAGPIEKSHNLLPQFRSVKRIDADRIHSGLKLMLWGFFKKLVIADKLALFINPIYETPSDYSGLWLGVATILFAFQVYCDFSGYTDIAIGCARIMGYDLMKNFHNPYFATSITEIWRRWHISLSDWINAYLYTPIVLGLRNHGKIGIIVSLVVTFTLVGLWHGAAWTFVFFGLLQGLGLTYELLTKKRRKKLFKHIPSSFVYWGGLITTFLFWCFTLVLFRAQSVDDALYIYQTLGDVDWSVAKELIQELPKMALLCVFIMQLAQFLDERKQPLSSYFEQLWWPLRYFGYIIVLAIIGFYGAYHSEQEFIYFQF